MFASSLGDSHIVKILLEYGASINDFASPHDWNPLCCALQANNKNVVRLLLDAKGLFACAWHVEPSFSHVLKTEAKGVSAISSMLAVLHMQHVHRNICGRVGE